MKRFFAWIKSLFSLEHDVATVKQVEDALNRNVMLMDASYQRGKRDALLEIRDSISKSERFNKNLNLLLWDHDICEQINETTITTAVKLAWHIENEILKGAKQ